MEERERLTKKWFDMWLKANCDGVEEIFTSDAVYIESWGPKYSGINEIRRWFNEWNTRGKVVAWDIKQFFHKDEQTVAEWYFCSEFESGGGDCFDGMSLIRWQNGKICFLKEFGCNLNNYDPYRGGDEPVFANEKIKWF